jgi:hypothetical protein
MYIVEAAWANLHRNPRYDFLEGDVDHFDPIFDFRVRSGLVQCAVKEIANLVMPYPIAKRMHVEYPVRPDRMRSYPPPKPHTAP